MSTLLESLIKEEIRANGPINIARFMELALGHPEYGYYMTRDPFGREGDFTTAPETSQIFGELIGAWLADIWIQMEMPGAIELIECGPGRGTLMADILRSTRKISGFHEALNIYMIETSPLLKEQQESKLGTYKNVSWYGALEDVPKTEKASLIIGNEFLDALPIHQLYRNANGWQERKIGLNADGELAFLLEKAERGLPDHLPAKTRSNTFYETAPARETFIRQCVQRIKEKGGVALFIDYGYDTREGGDTLQAIAKHDYANILKNIGEQDITAHVDFASVCSAVTTEGCRSFGIKGQGAFLQNLGAEQRAAILQNQPGADKKEITTALHRLTAASEMGTLFKVTGFSYGYDLNPAGF